MSFVSLWFSSLYDHVLFILQEPKTFNMNNFFSLKNRTKLTLMAPVYFTVICLFAILPAHGQQSQAVGQDVHVFRGLREPYRIFRPGHCAEDLRV